MSIYYARVWPNSALDIRNTAPANVRDKPIDEVDEWDSESCAEDYYHNHDGFEAHWPLTFALFDGITGPEIGRWEVALEYEPSFSASQQQEG
ncbi:hypothetical protein [Achromobacter insolitus]|uniref:hypothetical protein n=1 Tax=Achromobacter insolitus TaxID=217204 RepID=UPI0020A3448D|nr:hypothetical protein [Achromobacter insolitus]MCP1404466.1 hypothetical protein [Achromobacter insolitus]